MAYFLADQFAIWSVEGNKRVRESLHVEIERHKSIVWMADYRDELAWNRGCEVHKFVCRPEMLVEYRIVGEISRSNKLFEFFYVAVLPVAAKEDFTTRLAIQQLQNPGSAIAGESRQIVQATGQ